MKGIAKFLLFAALVALPPALAFALNAGISRLSSTDFPSGLVDGRLQLCPPGSDCVTSDVGEERVAALEIESEPATAFRSLVRFLIEERGARLVAATEDYAHLVFARPYVKLAESLELRLDASEGVIHARAAALFDSPEVDSAQPLLESVRGDFTSIVTKRLAEDS